MSLGPYRLIQLLGHRNDSIRALAFSPDGRLLAGGAGDGLIHVWDRYHSAPAQTLAGHDGFITSVRFGPDGRWLASSSEDGTVRLWDLANGLALHVLEGHQEPVDTVAVAPHGRWFASVSKHQLRLWNARTGAAIDQLALEGGGAAQLAVSHDENLFVAKARAASIDVYWKPARRVLHRQVIDGWGSMDEPIAISEDAGWFVSATPDGTCRLHDIRQGHRVEHEWRDRSLDGDNPFALAVSNEGSCLAIAYPNFGFRLVGRGSTKPKLQDANVASWALLITYKTQPLVAAALFSRETLPPSLSNRGAGEKNPSPTGRG